MLDQLNADGGIPHSYGISFASECRLEDRNIEAANIIAMAPKPTMPDNITADQLRAKSCGIVQPHQDRTSTVEEAKSL